MLRYALMLNDSTMINVNVFGLLINIIYMIVYYYYAPNTVSDKGFNKIFNILLFKLNLNFLIIMQCLFFFLERSA